MSPSPSAVEASTWVDTQLALARCEQAIEELPERYRFAARLLPPSALPFLKLAVLHQGATHPQLMPVAREAIREEINRLLEQLFPKIVGRPTRELKDKWLLRQIKNWYVQLLPVIKTMRGQRMIRVEVRRARLRETVTAVTKSTVGFSDAVLDSVLDDPRYSPKRATLALLARIVGLSAARIGRAIFRKHVAATLPLILTDAVAARLLTDARGEIREANPRRSL